MRKIDTLVAIAAVAIWCSSAVAADATGTAETESWNRLLQTHGVAGGLDYEGLSTERASLDVFLDWVAEADVAAMDDAESLAFWINAYNAVVALFVLERYPAIDSVRDRRSHLSGRRPCDDPRRGRERGSRQR
jgi:hypothetical protein